MSEGPFQFWPSEARFSRILPHLLTNTRSKPLVGGCKPHREFARRRLGLGRCQIDDAIADLILDPVPDPVRPGRLVGERLGPAYLEALVPAVTMSQKFSAPQLLRSFSKAPMPDSRAGIGPRLAKRRRTRQHPVMHSAVRERLTVLELETPPALRLLLVGLDGPAPPAEMVGWLSPGERARVAAFQLPHLARRYQWARVSLRALLGEQVGQTPQSLFLDASAGGRPFLPEVPGLDFNVSHASDLALIAIWTAPGRVGVDIEAVARAAGVPSDRQRGLEALVCTPRERSEFPVAPQPRAEAFLRLWTCKEACLKAIGTGLLTDPRELDVDITDEARPRLRASPDPRAFVINTFVPKPGFVSALALLAPPDPL